jgi:hypothetical protein
MDVWLGALAWGATEVAVLTTGAEAPQYRDALQRQMGFADAIAQALGYQGEHFRVVDGAQVPALETAIWAWQRALGVRMPATFNLVNDKRTAIAMAVEHLLAHRRPVP